MIEIEQARALLLQAMETQGRDFVYNDDLASPCFYVPNSCYTGPKSETGCLVGTALTLAGETRHLDYHGSVKGLHREYPNMMSVTVVEYFSTAQEKQDFCYTWGEAYDLAEESIISDSVNSTLID